MMKSLVLPLTVTAVLTSHAGAAQSAQTNAASAPKANTQTSDLFGNSVLAKGKGVEIKRSKLDAEVIRAKAQMAANGRPISPEQTVMMEQQILEQLINVQLLEAKATDADKAAGKAAAEKKFEDAKAKLGSEDALNRQLKIMGATREEVLAKWAEALTAETVLKRELKINITDADTKKFYDDNPSRFEQPESVRASHILLTTRDPVSGTDLPDDKKAAKRKEMEGLLKLAGFSYHDGK